jgi:putative oxidoreductase
LHHGCRAGGFTILVATTIVRRWNIECSAFDDEAMIMADRVLESPRYSGAGLAVLRIVTGFVFVMHGYQKFFGMGIGGVTGFFGSLGVPGPHFFAMVVSAVELVGGIALVLGVLTRFVAIPLIIDMMTAIVIVHAKNGFFVPKGIEFVLMLMTSCITLVLAGPGAFSIDRVLRGKQ